MHRRERKPLGWLGTTTAILFGIYLAGLLLGLTLRYYIRYSVQELGQTYFPTTKETK